MLRLSRNASALCFAATVLATEPGAAQADWPTSSTTNLPVCTATNAQQSPRIAPDMAGGAIIVWYDLRGTSGDIYAQHVFSNGSVDSAWPQNGIVVCDAISNQTSPVLVSDGGGGAIICWQDFRNGTNYDIYAQHLLGTGTVDPAWPVNGSPMCLASGDQTAPVGVSSTPGSAIFIWQDKRSGSTGDIYAQRIQSNGVVASGWPTDGFAVCTAIGVQQRPSATQDGLGGVFLAWQDDRDGAANTQIYAQHLRVDAALGTSWPSGGALVCGAPGAQLFPAVIGDGLGGAIAAWIDQRVGSTNGDIFAQHLLADGGVDPAWPANGGTVCNAPSNQLACALVGDGAHGAIVAWGDNRSSNLDIYAQRIRADGTLDPAWPINGLPVCTAANAQSTPALVTDGSGGALIAWLDFRADASASDLFAQHVLQGGAVAPGWPVDGVALCSAVGTQASHSLISDTAGGAICAWFDLRNGASGDIYSQRVLPTGLLGGSTVGVAPGSERPARFAVTPNPSPSRSLTLTIGPNIGRTSLELFDVTGRLVAARELDMTDHHSQQVQLNLEPNVIAGTYLVRLREGTTVSLMKIVLLR